MIIKEIPFSEVNSRPIRLEANHFLNNNAMLVRELLGNNKQFVELGEIAYLFNPPVFKRQFCTSQGSAAIKYFQSSDITALDPQSAFINKNQAQKTNTIVSDQDILVTGFGTIGNIRYINQNDIFDGSCVANNVCRIRVNDKKLRGYVYAFLASKYGRAQLNKNATGSVVKFIEAPGIKKTKIPMLDSSKISEIHNLIEQSATLRLEANDIFNECIDYFKVVKIIDKGKVYSFKREELDTRLRLESTKYRYSMRFEKTCKLRDIAECYTPPQYKHIYVDEKFGIRQWGSSDLFDIQPPNKFLSKIKTKNIEKYLIQKNDILMACSGGVGGTLGRSVLASKIHINEIGSNHIMRIRSNESNCGYLWAALSSPILRPIIDAQAFGTMIQELSPNDIGNIDIPLLDNIEYINKKMISVAEKRYESFMIEKEAIDLIEQELA